MRAWLRESTALPGGFAHHDGDALWVSTGIATPMFNGGTGGDAALVGRGVAALVRAAFRFFWLFPEGTVQDVISVLKEQHPRSAAAPCRP